MNVAFVPDGPKPEKIRGSRMAADEIKRLMRSATRKRRVSHKPTSITHYTLIINH